MTSKNDEKDIFGNNGEAASVSNFVAITENQRWALNKAGYTPNELKGMSKSTASKLINVTKANDGERLDADQVYALKHNDIVQSTRHLYLPPLDANLFPTQMKIDSEQLEYAVHGSMDKEARKEHHESDRRDTLCEIAENDATTAVQKAETLAYYRKHLSQERWQEFCDAIRINQSSADKLAIIGQTLTETSQQIKEELSKRGYNPMHSRDQWIFRATSEKYLEIMDQISTAENENAGPADSTDNGTNPRHPTAWDKGGWSRRRTVVQVAASRAEGTREATARTTPEHSRKAALRVVLEQQYGDTCGHNEEYDIMDVVQTFLKEKKEMNDLQRTSEAAKDPTSKGGDAVA